MTMLDALRAFIRQHEERTGTRLRALNLSPEHYDALEKELDERRGFFEMVRNDSTTSDVIVDGVEIRRRKPVEGTVARAPADQEGRFIDWTREAAAKVEPKFTPMCRPGSAGADGVFYLARGDFEGLKKWLPNARVDLMGGDRTATPVRLIGKVSFKRTAEEARREVVAAILRHRESHNGGAPLFVLVSKDDAALMGHERVNGVPIVSLDEIAATVMVEP